MSLEEMAEETPLEEDFNEETIESVADDVGDVAEEVDYSEVEQEAMKHGWRPDGVDGKRNLSAEEFMDRKPLFERMHKQDKKIKQLEEGLNAALEHDKLMRQRMHEQHIQELEEARKAAFENADYDEFDKVDKEIRKAEKDYEEPSAPTAENTEEVFKEWSGENSWYGDNSRLKKYADTAAMAFQAQNPNASFEDMLNHIANDVKETFPEEFESNPMSNKAPTVEGGSRGTGRKAGRPRKQTAKDLPEEVRRVASNLVRAGAFKSIDDYAVEYFAQTGE